jgi:hypothetical protein
MLRTNKNEEQIIINNPNKKLNKVISAVIPKEKIPILKKKKKEKLRILFKFFAPFVFSIYLFPLY